MKTKHRLYNEDDFYNLKVGEYCDDVDNEGNGIRLLRVPTGWVVDVFSYSPGTHSVIVESMVFIPAEVKDDNKS